VERHPARPRGVHGAGPLTSATRFAIPYELFLALRYLLAKRKQTFLSVISLISILGVTVGVMALVLALALMSGFQQDIRNKVLGGNAHITVFGGLGGRTLEEPAVLRERALAVLGVSAAAPLVLEKGLIVSDVNPRGYAAVIQGIDPALQGEVTTLVDDLRRGAEAGGAGTIAPTLDALRPALAASDTEAGRPATVFLGRELAFNLGVGPGDRVHLIVPQARLSPFSVRPKSVTYEVAGTPDSGFFDYDTSRVYLHLSEAQRLFGLGDGTTAMQVRCDAAADVPVVRARLQAALGDGLWVTDLIEQNRAFFAALRTEKLVSFLVIGLIMLVAALNIASTLILMVMEKVRDIGTLLSMGATSRGVMTVFLLQGAIIGVVGTAGGCVLGVSAAWVMDTYRLWALDPDVYFIDYLPFKVRLLDFLGTAAVALGISFVATLYPAWRASRLDPVEALRNE